MDPKTILAQMTLEEKAALCSGRDFWRTKAIDRLGVPSAMMCDGPHGLRKQISEGDHLGFRESIETVCYPTASALASSFDRNVLQRLGEALGQECQAEDIAMLLGPGLNMKRSPLCGRNFEYFSEDPYLAGELAAAYISSLQSKGVAACAKHFAANNQETRRMSGESKVDERTLHEIYLPAFEAAVKKGGTRSVMCAYNALNGDFCAKNKTLLTDILRDKWGFEGFVVTDWGAIKEKPLCTAAGLDLEMPGNPNSLGEDLIKAVQEGTLAEEDLDKAALNILKFVCDYEQLHDKNATIDRDECRALSRELAAECAVLLKNNGVLPLDEKANVVFIGDFALKPRYQGAGSSFINVPHPVGALEAAEGLNVRFVQGYHARQIEPDAALIAEAAQAAKDAQVAVIFAGLPDSFETEGADRKDMRMPAGQNALISAVAKANPNTVVVLHGGSSMEVPWVDEVAALLLVHLGGEQIGAAAVDLLYGKKNPSGHLAESWPKKLSDNPSYLNFPGENGIVEYNEGVFIGYRYYDKKEMDVQFPFGYGLSYTSFAISGLQADKTAMKDTEYMTVTCSVTNTGSRAGKTAVQLYVRDVESTVRRPVRELKGFEKVELAPGETKKVAFALDKRSFAYYEPKCNDWFVESGEFIIEVGECSRTPAQSICVQVEGTLTLPVHITMTSTIGEIMRLPKGAALFQQMMAAHKPVGDTDISAMGEGTKEMMQNMMFEMPLGALLSFGAMTKEQLEGIIAMLNE
ncbi:MAG: glycoside hydrolase family 3 C-terminal domain-containing protein [Clostridia bacterium]|nr:glycoside hydrolase family 3 C-terminal domain-containing protein [Clostridia bacterium]